MDASAIPEDGRVLLDTGYFEKGLPNDMSKMLVGTTKDA